MTVLGPRDVPEENADPASAALELGRQLVGRLAAFAVVDRHRGAFGGERTGDRLSDSSRRPSNYGHFARKAPLCRCSVHLRPFAGQVVHPWVQAHNEGPSDAARYEFVGEGASV